MTEIEVVNLETERGVAFKMAIHRSDTDPITQGARSGNWSLPLSVEMLLAGAPQETPVLDLGAHIGVFSLAAAAFGYNVIAVEASPRSVELLNASIQLNGFKNLRVVPAAVSDRVGRALFFENGPYGVVNTPRFAPPQSFEVATITVDELLGQVAIADTIRFVKMDIEGSEFAAVQGMSKLLAHPDAPPIFYESNGHTLYLFDKTPLMLSSQLRKRGYRLYLAEWKRLVPLGDDHIQYTCVVDCLAAKELVGHWRDWLSSEMTIEEQIQRALVESAAPSPAQRAHVARALEQTRPSILADTRIQDALMTLKMDNDPEVHKAMDWFYVGTSSGTG